MWRPPGAVEWSMASWVEGRRDWRCRIASSTALCTLDRYRHRSSCQFFRSACDRRALGRHAAHHAFGNGETCLRRHSAFLHRDVARACKDQFAAVRRMVPNFSGLWRHAVLAIADGATSGNQSCGRDSASLDFVSTDPHCWSSLLRNKRFKAPESPLDCCDLGYWFNRDSLCGLLDDRFYSYGMGSRRLTRSARCCSCYGYVHLLSADLVLLQAVL